ncbi:MAG: shikimate dehydrogenase [Candidatus Diapherotrites archaeon]|nr:shikimate dehydrogenase [Candidatus Diapherotrites archaeon]
MSEEKIFGLIGEHIQHSLSPAIHNHAFQKIGLNAHYILLDTPKNKLIKTIELIRQTPVTGGNVTIPFKTEIINHLDQLDPSAQTVAAVNTFVNEKGKLTGYNTDGLGAIKAIQTKLNPKNKVITILGCGGAGKAIAHSLQLAGVSKINLMDLNKTKACELAKKLEEHSKHKQITVVINTEQELLNELKKTDILINCSPIGMSPNADDSPISKQLLHSSLTVLDIVYNPIQTKLITDAKKLGCTVITGEKMLFEQALASFEIFTGKKAPRLEMLQALETELKRNGN